VGKKLLHAFEERMKEDNACRIMLIDTQSDNVAARAFFAKAGLKNFEDHRYYTKILPRAEEEGASEEELDALKPSARLMRLSKGKKVKVKDD